MESNLIKAKEIEYNLYKQKKALYEEAKKISDKLTEQMFFGPFDILNSTEASMQHSINLGKHIELNNEIARKVLAKSIELENEIAKTSVKTNKKERSTQTYDQIDEWFAMWENYIKNEGAENYAKFKKGSKSAYYVFLASAPDMTKIYKEKYAQEAINNFSVKFYFKNADKALPLKSNKKTLNMGTIAHNPRPRPKSKVKEPSKIKQQRARIIEQIKHAHNVASNINDQIQM